MKLLVTGCELCLHIYRCEFDLLTYSPGVIGCGISDASFQWPETRLGPLEPKDRRFPLPGLVGSSVLQSTAVRESQRLRFQRRPRYDADILVAELPYERQSTAFEQFVAVNTEV